MLKSKLKKTLTILLTTIVVGLFISYALLQSKIGKVQNIIVDIGNQEGDYFINRADVLQLLSANGQQEILGADAKSLNLKVLENRLKNHKFVNRSQVSRDFQGNMFVYLTQRKPLARILRQNGPGAYIDQDGNILPLSDKYTARVVLISGAYAEKLWKSSLQVSSDRQQLLNLLRYIDNSPEWRAQISQLDIDATGNITMYPQVTKQLIQFGKPTDYEEKFGKLNIFYKQILPSKGWNHYNRVDLRHKNQIVCE